MKIFKTNLTIALIVFIFSVILFSGCDVDQDEPGFSFLPDMVHSRAYETYSPNPNFRDSMTMRRPVEGTVPRGKVPYPYEKTEEDMRLAGKIYKNPLEPTDSVVQQGKRLYEKYCMICHGEQGKGEGLLVTNGTYNYQPRDLTSERVVNRNDGEIFHVITVGYGLMGAHGSIVREKDRWKVIHYIREKLQQQEE